MKFDTSTQKSINELIAEFRKENTGAPDEAITDSDAAVRYIAAHASAGQSVAWIERFLAAQGGSTTRFRKGSLVLLLAGLLFASVIMYGIFAEVGFLDTLKNDSTARGLITFLFSLTTISLILIAGIATFWVNLDEIEIRTTAAKDMIAILIGIMGTIIGFYFGSSTIEPTPDTGSPPAVTAPPVDAEDGQ
ncbi:hypothetical protein JJJ17_04465 [Paracoccus caeni]|uniref:Uncharacterized protein n=1 Tax=Paracoccus caeni TaxID=657651 RepID=A0A934VZU5_9RHOB|nr:hypothetical protein [Paracoccus caeni]MBK4215174.1 hypothetical protein [Paracoccus caeni]